MKAFILRYPLSITIIMLVTFLSFFKPPSTDLNDVPGIDKLVHTGTVQIHRPRRHGVGIPVRRRRSIRSLRGKGVRPIQSGSAQAGLQIAEIRRRRLREGRHWRRCARKPQVQRRSSGNALRLGYAGDGRR